LVVLVDADTASAAEVLAGALKDNGRARVLGQPTFGKGSSQGLIRLPDAIGGLPTGGLRLTIARFFSPKGHPYAGLGVAPDVLLPPFKPEALGVADPHILAAQVELQRQLALVR
jgi:carboxyl-terminal processing protease